MDSIGASSCGTAQEKGHTRKRQLTRAFVRWYAKGRVRLYAYNLIYLTFGLVAYFTWCLMRWASVPLWAFVFIIYITYRCYHLHNPRPSVIDEAWPEITHSYITARDGVRLHVQLVGPLPDRAQHVMMIANGVGGRLEFCEAIVKHYAPRGWCIITWDYRGLFGSGSPDLPAHLSVRDHADDVKDILGALGLDDVDVMLGWSMGVQIALEFVSIYPLAVQRLVLVNGTHGKVFQTAFQPLFRVPLVNDFFHFLAEMMIDRAEILVNLLNVVWDRAGRYIRPMAYLISVIHMNPHSATYTLQYFEAMFKNSHEHMRNHLRIGQELDAHSSFHALPSIQVPTFIVSGYLDVMTPAFQSFEMGLRLPQCWHSCYFCGTHLLLLEFPNEVINDIEVFLASEKFGQLRVREQKED